ncbi:unnamed protein product [Rotaria sp. Silwood1]|nr:unnamed protein product [Rotaria sp. Silwood1]CAF4669424.1 unnamed protein product [Rotaria sp. Silwood1]
MSDSSMKLYHRLYLYEYQALIIPTRSKRRFQLLYLLFSVNIIFFLIIYHRLILITPSSIKTLILDNTIIKNEKLSSSSICYIPHFDPWDQTVAKSIHIEPLYKCPTNKQNLINVINNTKLFINQTVNKTYYSNSITHCIYLKIDRNPNEKYFRDWSYTLSEPILIINGSTNSILDVDFVLTRCYNNRTGFFNGENFCGYNYSNNSKINQLDKKSLSIITNNSLVYEYVHPLIRLKKSPFSHDIWLEKNNISNNFSTLTSSYQSPPSVIMIILDAVSNLQAHRALPRTLTYLKTLGLYTFENHAIVGDGTFENIVPMLFGKSAIDLQHININDSRYEFPITDIEFDSKTNKTIEIKKIIHYPGPYDNYSFIIKNFSQLNYTTFFSEEWRESAFYNLKNGFHQSPTDYYLRPYWLSLYETLSYNKYSGNSNPKPCYLDKLLHLLSLNWLKQFLNVYHQTLNYPTFGILKINEMSHDYLERLFWIDNDLEKFFQNLYQQNLLNNTILILCGDHGHRQHHLRLTRIGSFEVKLPFFSILLPQSYKENFPIAIKNIEKNQHMLTSWWDVYETFVNILKMVEEPHLFDPLLVNWHPTTSGISLFHSIPERNCSSAGIPEKYCPCSRTQTLDITLPIVKELTIASINYINNNKLKNHQHLCIRLKLKTIIRAEVEKLEKTKIINNTTLDKNFTRLFTVLFDVSPSDAIFESNLLYDDTTKQIRLHSEILRINLYGQTSACIKDKYDLRSFCYCISYHKRFHHLLSRNKLFTSKTPIVNLI